MGTCNPTGKAVVGGEEIAHAYSVSVCDVLEDEHAQSTQCHSSAVIHTPRLSCVAFLYLFLRVVRLHYAKVSVRPQECGQRSGRSRPAAARI